MRERFTIILLILVAVLPIKAQDNPFGIDNECFALYEKAENLIDTPSFKNANAALLAKAKEKGDKKAETLYYVTALKYLTHQSPTPENDAAVDAARETLKRVSKEYGFSQYYYYSYNMSQIYYYNSDRVERTVELAKEMQGNALKEGDEYGVWSADKFLAQLYIEQHDYVSAKPHILRALDLYSHATSEALQRQSPTRLYCDLADTYPIGSDSVRINVMKALNNSKQHLDTIRCDYYLARLYALDGRKSEYARMRDKVVNDPQFDRMWSHGRLFFSLVDSVFDGSIDKREEEIFALSIREIKVIANICESQGYESFAFNVEKKLVRELEKTLSFANQSRLSELDVTLGKAALSADLAQKEEEISLISTLLIILLSILFAATAILSRLHIRNLNKNKAKDKARIAELQEANEKVRLADAAKTRFVQNMSHEVRTPLNAIVGFSQLLSLPDGSFSPDEKDEFAGHIINNTKMLTMLLDDILNASDMDSGNYSINYEDGECNFMAQAAISSSEHRLQPGVSMQYIPLPEPFTFRTDPRRVQQILINLLTNACKHTTQGSITLACSLTENPGEVTFSVTDTGPGVPPEQAEAIFDRFTKLNEFVQGTGLGLSICRDIAGRMGGRVFLDTAYPGPGARFVFAVKISQNERAE